VALALQDACLLLEQLQEWGGVDNDEEEDDDDSTTASGQRITMDGGGLQAPFLPQSPSLGGQDLVWAHKGMKLAIVLEGCGFSPATLPLSAHPLLHTLRVTLLNLAGWRCTKGLRLDDFMSASSSRARALLVLKTCHD